MSQKKRDQEATDRMRKAAFDLLDKMAKQNQAKFKAPDMSIPEPEEYVEAPGDTVYNNILFSDGTPVNWNDMPKPRSAPDENAFINHWAEELRMIYENRTAGDFTFDGVVSKILREAQVTATIDASLPKYKYGPGRNKI